jgi:hypothetical protein
MGPASIVIRLTNRLVPGYEQYHFTVNRRSATNDRVYGSRVIDKLLRDECHLPLVDFYIGGEIVERLEDDHREAVVAWDGEKEKNGKRPKTRLERLRNDGNGVTLNADPVALLRIAAEHGFNRKRIADDNKQPGAK